jgi:glycolate oxidase iron-sulfur subunit
MNENQFQEKLTLLDHLQSACTHCGICSESCATFQATGWEHESPRGRLKLASQFLHGSIHPQSSALSTFDHCLGCRACEPLCPHQVSYGQVRKLVQELRRELNHAPEDEEGVHHYRQWITLAQRMSSILWRRYGAKWLRIPFLEYGSKGSYINNRRRSQEDSAVLAVCCVQDLFQHDVIEQATAFIQRLGVSLKVDRNQPCCGALFERLVEGGSESIHYPKEWRKAVSLQKKRVNAFLKWMPDQTYFLSMGCRCFISLHHAQAMDLYEWIEMLLDQQKLTLHVAEMREVYYQPYCRSKKGKEEDSVYRLLQKIKGLKVREVVYPQACCGGYCGETILHPQNAQRMAEGKLGCLPDHATLVVTSPDCWSLFKSHSASRHLTVCYPIELLGQTKIKPET